jgi:hypothetical protein
MWGNPTRERDIIIQLQESTKQQQIHISSQGKYLTTPKQSQKLCLEKCAKFVLLYSLLRTSFSVPIVICTDCSVQPRNNKQISEICLENRAQNYLDFRAKYVLTPVQNCTDCTDPYSMASHSRKIIWPKTHRNFFLGFVPSFLGKRALFVAHFPFSSILKKSLSISSRCLLNMSCTLPNTFFYNLKMTVSPKCLFTFPNPKSKGQD